MDNVPHDEHDQQDDAALVPTEAPAVDEEENEENEDEDVPEAADMRCYWGVPSDVVVECERIYAASKAVRLEGLRRVRDLLAPHGSFKQWCIDHEESYGAVQYALSQAYGNVTKRSIEVPSTGGLLPRPAPTEEQTIIQSQADYIRSLEAKVARYERRTAAQWAAEALRQQEQERQEQHAALLEAYADKFERERALAPHWVARRDALQEAIRAVDGHMGLVAHGALDMGLGYALLYRELDDDPRRVERVLRDHDADRPALLHATLSVRTSWRMQQWSMRAARHFGLLNGAPETWLTNTDQRILAALSLARVQHVIRRLVALGVLDDLATALGAA